MADYKQYAHSFHCEVLVIKMNNVLFFKGNWNLHNLCIFPEIDYKANNSDALIQASNGMVRPEARCSQLCGPLAHSSDTVLVTSQGYHVSWFRGKHSLF